jgi:hypothetical protein
LLELVRQYAHEYLAASRDLAATRRKHTEFFLSFADAWGANANLGGPGRRAALVPLETEQDNPRAALPWCVEHDAAELGLRLGEEQ